MARTTSDLPKSAILPLTDIQRRIPKIRNLLTQQIHLFRPASLAAPDTHRRVAELAALADRLAGTVLRGASPNALFESFRLVPGGEAPDLEGLARLLSANLHHLRAGKAVRAWSRQLEDEWVPARIRRCETRAWRNSETYFHYHCDVLAGTPVGRTAYGNLSRRWAAAVSTRLGYSRWRSGKFYYQDPADLVGLRCYLQLSAERSREYPTFVQVAGTPGMLAWNRKAVLRLRCRTDCKCPRSFSHPCHRCAIGYEDCPAATHARTYQLGRCPGCFNPDAVFDPERTDACCLNCPGSSLEVGRR